METKTGRIRYTEAEMDTETAGYRIKRQRGDREQG